MLTCSWWRLSNSGEPLFAVGTTFITVAREGTFSCRTEKCYYKLNLINFIWHINVTISYQKMCHYSYKLVDNKNRKNSSNLRLIVEFTKLFRKLNKAYWKVQFCCICKHVSRGSLILFSWRVNGRFFFAWSVNEDFFSPDLWIYIFPSLGNWFSIFFVIHEKCIYFRVICEPSTFVGIIFHIFGDFSVIKACKLHQTGCKKRDGLPFAISLDAHEDGGLRTNHSNSESGGPRI